MADNPYMVSAQPNYAAPLVNFFGGQGGQQNQQQNQQQNRQAQPQAGGGMPGQPQPQGQQQQGQQQQGQQQQGFAQLLARLFGGQQQQGQQYQPSGPMNLNPGAQPPQIGPNGPQGLY